MFSNFASFAVVWQGHRWMTSEHAYQAAKFESERIRAVIGNTSSAHDAKKTARFFAKRVRADWEADKLRVMEEIVRLKFEQHEYIQQKLRESGSLKIIEDSPKDSFWGRGPDWKGENHLGKIWMKLRSDYFA
jgi:hypothetical protein